MSQFLSFPFIFSETVEKILENHVQGIPILNAECKDFFNEFYKKAYIIGAEFIAQSDNL